MRPSSLYVKHVLTAPNGTLAIYLALKAKGIVFGDEVVVPGLSFIATASAIAMTGAKPVFVDIKEEDFNLDPDLVESAITSSTKAIMPVHINGRLADMKALKKITEQKYLALIEDAAQAFGSFHDGRALGTLGDVGCISLAPTKIITCAQGGLLLTNDDKVKDQIIRLKDHGRLSRSWNHHPEFGANFKFNDLLAALALVQFEDISNRLSKAQSDFSLYQSELADIQALRFVETDIESGIVPLWVDAVIEGDREQFIEHMRSKNIICRPFWPAMHLQDAYMSDEISNLAITEKIADTGIWFPSGAGKDNQDISRVIDETKKYFRQ